MDENIIDVPAIPQEETKSELAFQEGYNEWYDKNTR